MSQNQSSGSATALVGQEENIVVNEKECKNKGKCKKAFMEDVLLVNNEDDMTLSKLLRIRGNTLVKNSSSEGFSKNVVDSSSLPDSSTPLLETISPATLMETVSSNHLLETTQIPELSDTYEPSNFEGFEQRRETLNYTLKPHPLQVQLHEQQPQPEQSNPFTSSASDLPSADPIALANQIGNGTIANREIGEEMDETPIGIPYSPLQTEYEPELTFATQSTITPSIFTSFHWLS
jgi:hypothetical protein